MFDKLHDIIIKINEIAEYIKHGMFKDRTVLVFGESMAGKDTFIKILLGLKYEDLPKKEGKVKTFFRKVFRIKDRRKLGTDETFIYEIIKSKKIGNDKKKPYYFINTPGNNNSRKKQTIDTARKIPHSMRCYIFDCRYYNTTDNIFYLFNNIKKMMVRKNIERGIINMVNFSLENENIKCFAIGTHGNELQNKIEVEKKISDLGVRCKIFELSESPQDEIINFILD
ncbi:hypothetical protein OFR22_01050 [Brachyspira hyodysenteriae]|uniref:hypothetical protein n=1 Tax=Brachyspira hyodysenteriae TaxID=159 RepID=UPI0022CD88C4|nr:hypothetical protein [Brachyspira hyodysenteriae]MCZ9840028.1 hypothetical protein [Brachyspira hyodysenteriae]MCZ9848427.1 hypothetical protein [Brachyspira hyodysenteriae]MCZ9852098.1 hypothetical protein [Brachyspira hyodysenteriae]MCZ9861722.1 hypothetical protein [Brachyspira hyodysenteriae]MCZ9868956.1 hypothetical protein [Brachyspira hyodysenteriae]